MPKDLTLVKQIVYKTYLTSVNIVGNNVRLHIFNQHLKPYWLRDAPTGLTCNNCTLCPHCIYVFCIYLFTTSELCRLHHKLIGFYKRNEKCLLRGTNWGLKYGSLLFVFKELLHGSWVIQSSFPYS